MQDLVTIIMAGGMGKRMNSETPKVLHVINDKPMIYYVIQRSLDVKTKQIYIVVGKYQKLIQTEIEKYFTEEECKLMTYVLQPQVLVDGELKVQGTGDAIKCCIPYFLRNQVNLHANVLILSGDVPLIHTETIKKLLDIENSMMITKLDEPKGCGRVLFSDTTFVERIIEEKDCNDNEKKIKYINCGIYNLKFSILLHCIDLIKNNNKNKEYYLTDLIEIAYNKKNFIKYYELPFESQYEIININTQEDLLRAQKQMILS